MARPRTPLLLVLLAACGPVGDDDSAVTSSPQAHPYELITEQAGLGGRVMGGPGVAAGDVDKDGDVDLYFTSNVGPGFDHNDQLFLNDGAGHFTDGSAAWGVGQQVGRSWGAVFADLDNDGDADLLVANSGRHDLYINEGDHFTRRTNDAGFRSWGQEVYAASMNLADYDGDGILDLYVVNHQFQGADQVSGPFPEDELYHGDGDGTFTEVSELLPGDRTDNGGFVAAWTDIDDDADLDLYLVSDSAAAPFKNQLFRNDGPGAAGGLDWTFSAISEDCGCDLQMDGMGLAIGDYDGDGNLDFYVTNTGGEKLLRRSGAAHYADTTLTAGADAGGGDRRVSWGTEFVDMNNDTWPDLIVAFGGKETFDEVRNSILLNEGGTFIRRDDLGLAHEADSHGLAVLDLERDGCMDLVIANLQQPPELHRGVCGGHWVGLELRGTDSNRDAAGTRVRVTTGERTQVQEVWLGSTSVHSGRWKGMHFGLGEATEVDDVEVRWPDGTVSHPDLTLDHWNEVVE